METKAYTEMETEADTKVGYRYKNNPEAEVGVNK